MGDHVYICGWSTSNGTFDLWVKAQPNIRGTGENYDHAQEALRDAIADNGGAKQATFEFVPPLPASDFDLAFSTPQLYLISGDEGFDADEPRSRAFETDAQRANRGSTISSRGESARIALAHKDREAVVRWKFHPQATHTMVALQILPARCPVFSPATSWIFFRKANAVISISVRSSKPGKLARNTLNLWVLPVPRRWR